MRIGYACKCVAVPGTGLRTCTAANAAEERLTELIDHNLNALDAMLDYNCKNDIRMFRISSDIIPFGSSPVNTLNWTEIFAEKLKLLGEKAISGGIRLSMHPGQYTVLNSPDEDVVKRAVRDLEYHCAFLDTLGLSGENKIILHIGGVYGDKKKASERFCENYKNLSDAVKARLVIENDERNYTIEEVCRIGNAMGIPVVFDNLHHALNNSETNRSERKWLELCGETWKEGDGVQKMHYSQQAEGKRRGAHSDTIDPAVFKTFLRQLPTEHIDIMLEVKDKNQSAVKCMNYVGVHHKIKYLEAEWARYKYDILSCSQNSYNQIRQLLKEKHTYPAEEFYQLIQEAYELVPNKKYQLNAIDHVWGYFRKIAADREKAMYKKKVEEFTQGKITEPAVRRFLYRLACSYEDEYLLNSYYFSGF